MYLHAKFLFIRSVVVVMKVISLDRHVLFLRSTKLTFTEATYFSHNPTLRVANIASINDVSSFAMLVLFMACNLKFKICSDLQYIRMTFHENLFSFSEVIRGNAHAPGTIKYLVM